MTYAQKTVVGMLVLVGSSFFIALTRTRAGERDSEVATNKYLRAYGRFGVCRKVTL
jgi:predicted RecA/RadA family phage recombinase